MFTIFDLLKLLGAAAGAVLGGGYGYQTFGWLGAVIGLPLGLLVGSFVFNLPLVVGWAWMRYDLKRSSIAKLKNRLHREYAISHLLIAELVSRGEPPGQFREYVAGLLRSNNPLERHCGEGTAGMWFPDLLVNSSSLSSAEDPTANDRDA